MRWAVLLRGVNVKGVTVKSAELTATLASAGFTAVKTVLASGNVALDADDALGRDDVKARVEKALREGFGYDAWVVVVDPRRLAEIAAGYPFERTDETHHPYVVFASDPARLADLVAGAAGDEDVLELAGDVLYWKVERGRSTDTPFAKASGAARWKPHLTTRNLRTVDKLLAACG